MQKELMTIQSAINQIQEVIDSTIHRVTMGGVCPTCGAVDNFKRINNPVSCEECLIEGICKIVLGTKDCGGEPCKFMWEKIVEKHEKINCITPKH